MHAGTRGLRFGMLLALAGVFAFLGCTLPKDPYLDHGRILIATDDEPTRHAANELQSYLVDATGQFFEPSTTESPGDGPVIVVG